MKYYCSNHLQSELNMPSACYSTPFPFLQQNGHLSFVPEDYGKEKPPPPKRTRNHTHSATPTGPHSNGGSAKGSPEDDDEEEEELQPGQLKCEFCHIIGDRESFLPPSRRFCSITCCKRYSAEKRYYPYGRDPQGIAKSIREGLLNPKSRHLRGGASKVSYHAQLCEHYMHVYIMLSLFLRLSPSSLFYTRDFIYTKFVFKHQRLKHEFHVNKIVHIPYSWKIWRELNLADWRTAWATAKLKSTKNSYPYIYMYGDPVPNHQI